MKPRSFLSIALALFCAFLVPASADTVLTNLNGFNNPLAVALNPATNLVYVGNGPTSTNGTVSVLDAATGMVITTVPVGIAAAANPVAIAINPITNQIYVACLNDTAITVIDGNTNQTTNVMVGTNPIALAVNPVTNQIYVAINGNGTSASTVTVIDGATNSTNSILAGVAPFAVAVNPVTNQIYVANYGFGGTAGAVTVINGATNNTSSLPAGVGCGAIAVNPVTNRIYATNSTDGTVTVIDGSTNTVLAAAVPVGSSPEAVAVNPITNQIYVANNGSGNITALDGATNATAAIGVGNNPAAIAINSATGKVYVANQGDGSVSVIPPRIGPGPGEAIQILTTGAGIGSLAVNPITNKIYAPNPEVGTVSVIDGADNNASTVFTGQGPSASAVDSVSGTIYVTGSDTTLTAIDALDDSTTNYTLPASPFTVAVNPITHLVYATDSIGGNVMILDPSSGVVTKIPAGTSPSAIAINPVTNQIYILNTGGATTGSVTVLDGASNTTTNVPVGMGPTAIAADPVTNQIFVTNQEDSTVSIIDGFGNIGGPPITLQGIAPAALAINSVTGQVYVADAGDDTVFAINELNLSAAPIPIPLTLNQFAPLTNLSVNPVTNTIFVGVASGTQIAAIDGVTNTPTYLSTNAAPGAVLADPTNNKLYVSCLGAGGSTQGTVMIFDGATSSSTSASISVTAGIGPTALAINPVTGKIYATNTGEASVTLIVPVSPGAGNLATFINPPPNHTSSSTATSIALETDYFADQPASPAQQTYYQVDSLSGPWMSGNPASLVGLPLGFHTLYAFSTEALDATDINAGAGDSPFPGQLSASTFLVGQSTFSFSESSVTARDTDPSVTITVTRNFSDPATVAYQTFDGTAAAGQNYVAVQGTLTFAQDQLSQTVTVPLINQTTGGGLPSTSFSFQLFNATGFDNTSFIFSTAIEVDIVNTNSTEVALSLLSPIAPAVPAAANGSLSVTLSPSAANGAWRLFGDLEWQASGNIVSGLTAGNYEVEFMPVDGYQAPAILTEPVTAGAMAMPSAAYIAVASQTQGSLTVTLAPSTVGGWQFQGEMTFRASGSTAGNLNPGSYLVVFEAAAGFATPSIREVFIQSDQTTAIMQTYAESDAGAPNLPVQVSSSLADTTAPYEYVGQIQTDNGFGTGFAPLDRVVVTSAQVIFDDASLAYAQGVRWFFQREVGVSEAPAQIPRGSYLFDGYAAQRTADNTPGISSTASQQLDVAALYFLEATANGGQSGYLASDSTSNSWLTNNSRNKQLVGYPVSGISSTIGQLYATNPDQTALMFDAAGLFFSTDFAGYPGMSGSPVCVQYGDGVYYPAAIYLGGTTQGVPGNDRGGTTPETVVRAIDSQVINLMNLAEVAGNGGVNHLGGGVVLAGLGLNGTTAFALGQASVSIGPADAVAAGGRWGLQGQKIDRVNGQDMTNVAPGSYTVAFSDVPNYTTPSPVPISVAAGGTATATGNYTPNVPPAITSSLTANATMGIDFRYQIGATYDPITYTVDGLPTGLVYNKTTGVIYGAPTVTGLFNVSLTATNAHGPTLTPAMLALNVAMPGQLTVSVNGKGSVPHSFMGTTTQSVGSALSITATPATGYLFDSWRDAKTSQLLSSQAKYRFTMLQTVSLQANFVTNRFLTAKGSYFGLLQGSDYLESGFLQMSVSSLGSFTASISLGGITTKLNNSFTDQGQYSGQIVLPDGRLYNVTLNLTANGFLTGSLVNQGDQSQLLVSVSQAAPPAKSQIGAYTAVLPLTAAASDLPAGDGYGTITVSKTGAAVFNGSLGDGTSVHYSGSVDSHGAIAFYTAKAAGKTSGAEIVLGTLAANIPPATAGYSGTLNWFRQPLAADPLYPSGFATQITCTASSYKPPAVDYSTAVVTFSGGGFGASVSKIVSISSKGVVTYAGSDPFKLTFTVATGLFTGSYLDPDGHPRTFNGALIQSENLGLGLYQEPGEVTGAVSITGSP